MLIKKDKVISSTKRSQFRLNRGLVPRPRLLKLLENNLASYNATIINGRAGTGKTVLAEDFARHSGRAVSWYKVDASDTDLRVFCEYLLASIKLQRFWIDSDRLLQLTERPSQELTR